MLESNAPIWGTVSTPIWGTTAIVHGAKVPIMGNGLKRLREFKGWTHEEAAQALGVSRSQFIKLERGERRLTADYIVRAANAFGVSEMDVIGSPRQVQLVGYVSAGASAVYFGEGDGNLDLVDAPEGSTEMTVAVEVRGQSLGPLFDHWLVFYDEIHDPPHDGLANKLCVVGLSDGRVLIKQLQRTRDPTFWHLLSNSEPPIFDQVVSWAAPVKSMSPRR